MHKQILQIASIISLVVLIAMLNTTNPTSVGPLGVLVFFTTLYFLMFMAARIIIKIVYKIIIHKGWGMKDELYAVALAFAPIMLLFMKSFATINIFSMFLVGLFELITCFLIAKKM